MKIKMPAGFLPPKGVKPGEAFDAVASMKQEKDGSYELISMDGAPMSGKAEEDAEPEQDDMEEGKEARPVDSSEGIRLPWNN